MIPKYIIRFAFLIVFCLFLLWWYRQRLARKRFVATVKTMAEDGRNEINGQPIKYWLDRLNHISPQTLSASDTMVLMYKGQEYFFVNGKVAYITYDLSKSRCTLMKSCFLIAVGQPAVRLLSERDEVFRLIAGSTELAAFSIYRWTDFVVALMSEKPIAEIRGSEGNSSGQK